MTNKPKAKGTALETAVVRWANLNGFPGAQRQPLYGNGDRGDIALCPGIILECKSYASAALGQPAEGTLAAWLLEAERERINAGADFAFVVAKRKGTTYVGRYWAWTTAGAFLSLVDAPTHTQAPGEVVCTSVASLGALLRAAGYGSGPYDVRNEDV